MRKKEIKTIQDWRAKLFIIVGDFFSTDFSMQKKGIIYEKNFYHKKILIRLRNLFANIKSIIEKSNYEEVIKELEKPEKIYFQRLEENAKKWLGKEKPLMYVPEEDTEKEIFVWQLVFCLKTLERIKNNTIEREDWDVLLKICMNELKNRHLNFRKRLQDYGYSIKKEKKANRTKNAKRRLFICYNKKRKTTKIQRLSYKDKSNEKDDKKRTKMKKVRRIITIKHWMDALHFVFYNFFYTDYIMYKQGTFYEKETYQKKTIIRLTFLFSKLDKIIKKSKKEELVEELKKPQEMYLQRLNEFEKKWLGKEKPLRVFVPEKDTEVKIFISHMTLCQEILKKIMNNDVEKKEWDVLLKIEIKALKGMHKSFRKDLRDYGYIIKKEKEVKYLKK